MAITDGNAPIKTSYGETERGSANESSCYHSRVERSEQGQQHELPDYFADGLRPDGSYIDRETQPSTSLATVLLSNGARVEFSAVEESAGRYGIAMRELCDAERIMPSVLATMGQRNALEIYTALCPKAPIPRRIAAYTDSKSTANLVDVVEEPLEADLDELAILPPVKLGHAQGGGYGGQFCVPGDGWYAFRDFACNWSGPSNTWFWCDPSVAYYYRARWTSGHKRRHSFGITATCGTSANTSHWYWNGHKWKHLYTWYLPDQHWQWTRYDGLAKWDRKVMHVSDIQGPPSFVRSITAIYT